MPGVNVFRSFVAQEGDTEMKKDWCSRNASVLSVTALYLLSSLKMVERKRERHIYRKERCAVSMPMHYQEVSSVIFGSSVRGVEEPEHSPTADASLPAV